MKRTVILNRQSLNEKVDGAFDCEGYFKKVHIKVIIYDFDGVMTDNKVLVFSDGTEGVVCNRGDGLAVSEIKKLNIHQCIVSTESNHVVKRRAEKLGIHCIQGVSDKKDILLEYVKNEHFELKNVAYVGNDINDLEAMKLAALKISPRDAAPEVLAISDIITDAKGGDGVIYEIYRRYFLCQVNNQELE